MADQDHYYNEIVHPNVDLNALSSIYASTYGHDATRMISDMVFNTLFDASHTEYVELQLMYMKGLETVTTDEVFYGETPDQRSPIFVQTTSVSAAATQTIVVQNVDDVAENMVLNYPANDAQGTVISVNKGTSTIVVQADTGETLPAIVQGDELIYNYSIEADGDTDYAFKFRMSTIERVAYIQLFGMSRYYDEVELIKIKNHHRYANFLETEAQQMVKEFRKSASIAIINGRSGEGNLSNSRKAKKMGGVIPAMIAQGAPQIATLQAGIGEAVERAAALSEFGNYGQVKFLMATPEIINVLSKYYKASLTRYQPTDTTTKINLTMIDYGSTKLAMMPKPAFRDRASYPDYYRNHAFIVPWENVQPIQIIAPRFNHINYDARNSGGGRIRKGMEIGFDMSLGLKCNNMKEGAIIHVTDL